MSNPATGIEQRLILVTGASRGIGRALSLRLLEAGARVIGLGRDFSHWRLPRPGFEVAVADLSDLDHLPRRLADLARAHPAIDAVVSNAGVGRFGHLEQFSARQIRESVDINLTQHILVARTLLPLLKRRVLADLIFTGSESALTGGPRGAVYSACKFGLRGLAQSLRQECAGSGVRVGIVNPGMVRSSFFAGLDFGPAPDGANAIEPPAVAELILAMLNAPPGTVVDEINLSPLKKVIRFGRGE